MALFKPFSNPYATSNTFMTLALSLGSNIYVLYN